MKNLKDKLILLENHFVLSLSNEELDSELIEIKAEVLTEIVLIKHLLARGDNGKTEIN